MKTSKEEKTNVSFLADFSNLKAMKLNTIRKLSRGANILRNELNNASVKLTSDRQIDFHLTQLEKILAAEKSR